MPETPYEKGCNAGLGAWKEFSKEKATDSIKSRLHAARVANNNMNLLDVRFAGWSDDMINDYIEGFVEGFADSWEQAIKYELAGTDAKDKDWQETP